MLPVLERYARWLHTQWPAGTVEPFPEVREDGSTRVPGVYLSGDLTGVPLLKFALDSGARVVQRIAEDPDLRTGDAARPELVDLVIIGAGVSGMAAAVEAKRRGLSFEILEASEPLYTLINFPRRKPIYTYPRDMRPAGDLQVRADLKESLVQELKDQIERAGIRPIIARAERIERTGEFLTVHLAERSPLLARRVLVAIGRSGNFRRLDVAGEELDKVYNRLHDPNDFSGQRALVIGGGDSALEAAIALAIAGADVTLSYRKREFSRPKPENIQNLETLSRDPAADVTLEHPTAERVTTAAGRFMGPRRARGRVTLRLGTRVQEIRGNEVTLVGEDGSSDVLGNDVVFSMIGRDPPLEFFRRSGISVSRPQTWGKW